MLACLLVQIVRVSSGRRGLLSLSLVLPIVFTILVSHTSGIEASNQAKPSLNSLLSANL